MLSRVLIALILASVVGPATGSRASSGPQSGDAAHQMRQWDHGEGFSLNATVRTEATDRMEGLFGASHLEWATPSQRLLSSS